jgi:DNA-binding SARP family transcriptional activator
VEFRILGPLEVWANGRRVPLGSAKQRALLAALLLRPNEVVAAGELAEALWGERPPPSAPKLVQVYVSQLRRSLDGGAAVVVTRGRGYAAEVGARELDSVRFEGLLKAAEDVPAADALALYEKALALWRGPVLADVALESHAQPEAERLEELRLTALTQRNDCLLALGRDAVADVDALVRRHPLNERFRAQLMLALYRSGRQSDALAAYRDARATLVDELGIEPSRELQELERKILVHDPSLDAPPPSRRGRRRQLAVAAAVVLVALAVSLGVLLMRGSPPPVLARLAPDSIGIVDPNRNALVDAIPLQTRPAGIVFAQGALWVATKDDHTLLELDPVTHVQRRSFGIGIDAGFLAADGDTIWAFDFLAHTLVEVRTTIGSVVRTIVLPPLTWTVSAGAGAAWISEERRLVRVDARTGTTSRLDLDVGDGIAFDGRFVWAAGRVRDPVAGLAGTLTRIDPRTQDVTRGPRSPDLLANSPSTSLVAAYDAVWGVSQSPWRSVWRVDADSLQPTSHLRLRQGPIGIAAGSGAIWTANDDGTVSRIDPETGQLQRTIPLGTYPRVAYPIGITVGAGRVWVAVR